MATGRVPTTANSPLTAKGDLFTYSTAPARLAVGNDGEQIVADSAATTGLRYSATPSASNPILNSAMQVWQRGTSFTATNVYTADRWYKGAAPAATYSRQTTSDTTNLPFIQYCTRIQRNSASTATNAVDFGQSFESVNSIPFAGKTITLSFYARAGANYSATSSAMTAQVYSGTGTDQSIFTGFTGQATVISSAVTLTTTWQRFTATATVGATATQLAIYFQYSPTGTASTNDYFEVTGVQLDIGSVALPFRTYAATLQGELAACLRYYQVVGTIYGAANGVNTIEGLASTAVMRTTPTIAMLTSTPYGESPPSVTARNGVASATSILDGNAAQGGTFIRVTGFTSMTNLEPAFVAKNQVSLSAEL